MHTSALDLIHVLNQVITSMSSNVQEL